MPVVYRFVLQEGDQHPRRDRAHLALRHPGSGEWRIEKAHHRDVVDAHEREISRDTYAHLACRAQGAECQEVVRGEDRGRRHLEETLRRGMARVLGVGDGFRDQRRLPGQAVCP